MFRRIQLVAIFAAVLIAASVGSTLPRTAAQEQGFTREILARARVFPGIGPGLAALKRDTAGRYFILAEPADSIAIYTPAGQRAGQIPNANSKGAKITYAQDFDLDAAGRLFVADRGANAVKIFDPDGSLAGIIHVTAPTSVVSLPGDELAIAALRSAHLVTIYDVHGRTVRAFGDAPIPNDSNPSRLASRGQIYGDPTGRIYFAFTDLPDPTVRNYDRFGYVASEISLLASEFTPQAEARNWSRVTIEKGGSVSTVKPVISALGVDPENEDLWIAIGDELIHYDKDANRRATYRTSTKEGAPIEPIAILIEHDRILIGSDPLGIFDFALPEPRRTAALHP